METNYIALAVPVFFALMGIELLLARRRGRRVCRLNDAIADLSCGIASQLALLFWATGQVAIYAWVFERWRLHTFDSALGAWAVAFVGVDFIYYWWHRASHRVNVLWAAHVVHHQSEDYNLAVALRQSVLTSWTSLPFYLPLALLGVSPPVYVAAVAFSTLYQFWIHTELVGPTRGPLDWILNLPSHHRVHHATNARYLDKNYGATLIVWDRLFGTYEPETERPVYGITTPLASFNPLWAQVHYWFELARTARAARRWRDRIWLWLAPPDWQPAEALPVPQRAAGAKFDPIVEPWVRWYVGINFVPVVVATFALMMWGHRLPVAALAAGVGLVFVALFVFGAMLEGRRWALPLEAARVGASVMVAAAALGS